MNQTPTLAMRQAPVKPPARSFLSAVSCVVSTLFLFATVFSWSARDYTTMHLAMFLALFFLIAPKGEK